MLSSYIYTYIHIYIHMCTDTHVSRIVVEPLQDCTLPYVHGRSQYPNLVNSVIVTSYLSFCGGQMVFFYRQGLQSYSTCPLITDAGSCQLFVSGRYIRIFIVVLWRGHAITIGGASISHCIACIRYTGQSSHPKSKPRDYRLKTCRRNMDKH